MSTMKPRALLVRSILLIVLHGCLIASKLIFLQSRLPAPRVLLLRLNFHQSVLVLAPRVLLLPCAVRTHPSMLLVEPRVLPPRVLLLCAGLFQMLAIHQRPVGPPIPLLGPASARACSCSRRTCSSRLCFVVPEPAS